MIPGDRLLFCLGAYIDNFVYLLAFFENELIQAIANADVICTIHRCVLICHFSCPLIAVVQICRR